MAFSLYKWLGYKKYDKEEKPTVQNEYDNGKYWDKPIESSSDPDLQSENSFIKKWLGNNNTFTPDPNYYQHKSIQESTDTLRSSGLDVPAPDVAKPEKKVWWEQITDPISSLQYGLAHGIKNAVDDKPETGFLEGVGKGFAAGFDPKSKRLADRTSFKEVLDTMLNSPDMSKQAVGSAISNFVTNSKSSKRAGSYDYFVNAIQNAKAAYDISQSKTPEELMAKQKAFVDEAKKRSALSGMKLDMVADPENLLDGYLKAPVAMIKGTKVLSTADKAKDATKAASALLDIGKEGNMKQIEYLMKKTQKVLGGMPDYEGFKIAGKTVASPEQLAKFGDKLGLSKLGEGLSAVGNSDIGQALNKMFRFGRNGEYVIAAKNNPDDALKYIAQTQGIKDITNRMLKRKSDVLDLTKQTQMEVTPEEQHDITRSLEGIMTPEQVKRITTETVANPKYRVAINKSRSKLAYQIRQLAGQKVYLEKKLASLPPTDFGQDLEAITQTAALKAQLAQLNQDMTMLNNIHTTVGLSFENALKEADIGLGESDLKDMPLFYDPMEAGSRSIDEVADLIKNIGLKIPEGSERELALRLKQASDGFLDNLEQMFPDLQYAFSNRVKVTDYENGLAKAIERTPDLSEEQKYINNIKNKTEQLEKDISSARYRGDQYVYYNGQKMLIDDAEEILGQNKKVVDEYMPKQTQTVHPESTLALDPSLEQALSHDIKPEPEQIKMDLKPKMSEAEREAAIDKWLKDLRQNAPEKPEVKQPIKDIDTTPLDESIKMLSQKADYPIDEEYFKNATWQQKAGLRDKLNQIIKTNQRPLNDKQKNLIRMRLNQSGVSTTKEDVEKMGYYKFQQILDAMKNGTFDKMVKDMKGWKDPTYTEKVRMRFADMLEYERVKAKDALSPLDPDYIKAPSMRTTKDRFVKDEMVDSKEIEKLEKLEEMAKKKLGVKQTKTEDIKRLEDMIAEYKSKGKQTTGLERQLQKFKENSIDKDFMASGIIERYRGGSYVSVQEVNEAKKELNELLNGGVGNVLYKASDFENPTPDEINSFQELLQQLFGKSDERKATVLNFIGKNGQRFSIDDMADPQKVKQMLESYDSLPEPLQEAAKQAKLNVIKHKNGTYGMSTPNGITMYDTDALDGDLIDTTLKHELVHASDRLQSDELFQSGEREIWHNTLKGEMDNLTPKQQDEFLDMIKHDPWMSQNDARALKEGYVSRDVLISTDMYGDDPDTASRIGKIENLAYFGELLLGTDVKRAQKTKELFPQATQAFYDYIAKTPTKDLMDEVAMALPSRSKARNEIASNILKTKETLKTFQDILDNSKLHGTIDHTIKQIDKRIKEFNEKMVDIDFLKKKNPDLFKDVPEFNTITHEFEETILKPIVLGEKAGNIKDIIQKHFKEWADEEGIQEIENYVTHLLNWDLKKDKKTAKLYEDVFNPFDKYGINRKLQGTIDEINEAMKAKYGDKLNGKPFFETLISRIYMERGLYHANFMFDKEYADQTIRLFGKRIDKGFFESLEIPERKKQYWEEIQKYMKDPNYVIVKEPEKYTPVNVKVLENGDIEEGYRRRTAKRETARLMETDNPIVEQLNNMQISNPYIEINPKEIKNVEMLTKENTPVYIMPRDAYNAYTNSIKNQFDKQRGALARVFDKVMSVWKGSAILSPGFHMTNSIGNMFNSSLEIGGKILDPKLNAFAAMLQRDKGFEKVKFMNKTVQEWRDILRANGMKDVTFFSDNMTEFRHGELDSLIREQQTKGHRAKDILNRIANPMSEKFIPREVNTRVGSAIESQARIVNFLAHVEAGKTYEEAADLVNKVLFDYQDLTPFEHNVMKRLIPFYTWIRKNTPLQIEKFMEDPTRYSHVAKTMRNFNPESEEEKRYKPDYLNGALHVGKNTYKNVKLPFMDVSKVADPSDMLSSANPLIKMAVELGANKNFFTGQSIDEGYDVKAQGLMKLLGSDSPKGKLIDPRIKYILQNMMPGANRFNDIIQSNMPDATASEKAKVKRTWNPAHISEFTFDTEQQKKTAMYDYMEKLLKAVEKARKEGRLK